MNDDRSKHAGDPMPEGARQDRFLGLLEENKKILYKVAASYCRTPADRQDLVQEIVAQMWRSFGRYDERFRFATWMYRIALNVAISYSRSETSRSRRIVPAGDSILEIAAADPEDGEQEEQLRLLHRFIQQLDELDRALVLLYLDGNSYETIGDILGISETNVGTKIGRIKQRLRRDVARTA